MVYGTIAAVVVSGRVVSCRVGSGRVGSGRVGSGRVGSGRIGSGGLGRVVWTPFLLDPSVTFFRTTVTIAPCTVHFVLLHERLGQAILSINKLSQRKRKKSEMQNTIASHYYKYYLRVSSGATY